jgi:hypothetical protein
MMVHRAVTLLVVMVLAVVMLGLMIVSAVGTFDSHSLVALAVVLIAAAAGGVAFSWKRYYRR